MIRHLTIEEMADLGDAGVLVGPSLNEPATAIVQYAIDSQGFYAHSLASNGATPSQIAEIFQAVRRIARDLGYDTIRFTVEPEFQALLKLADKGRAKVKRIELEISSGLYKRRNQLSSHSPRN